MLAVKKPVKEKGKIKDFQAFEKEEQVYIAALTTAKSIRVYEVMQYLRKRDQQLELHVKYMIQLMEMPTGFTVKENLFIV